MKLYCEHYWNYEGGTNLHGVYIYVCENCAKIKIIKGFNKAKKFEIRNEKKGTLGDSEFFIKE